MFRDFFGEALKVARIRDEDILASLRHDGQAIPLQRKDVIQRQCRDSDDRLDAFVGVSLPGDGLQDVVDHVAVTEHRTLRHAGRTAGVLQVRDVGITDFHIVEYFPAAGLQGLAESHAVGKLVRRHHALDMAQYDINDHALWPLEQVTHASGDNAANIGIGDDFLKYVRKILKYDYAAGAGILELVFQLAGGIQRIDVHCDESGAKNAAHRHRVLQDIRQHDGHALTSREAKIFLQIAGELHR